MAHPEPPAPSAHDGAIVLNLVGGQHQGWEGGLAGLATDYGVSIDADDGEPQDGATGEDEFDVIEQTNAAGAIGESAVREATLPGPVIEDSDSENTSAGPENNIIPARNDIVKPPAIAEGTTGEKASVARVRIAAVKSAAVPTMRLADDAGWQPSRLFSMSGIGGVDEQENRATSALLWAMSAVRPLGRSLTARGDPAGVVETFLEVGFPLGEQRVIPDGVIRIARGGRVWTALVEVKTGDGVCTANNW